MIDQQTSFLLNHYIHIKHLIQVFKIPKIDNKYFFHIIISETRAQQEDQRKNH